MMSYYEIMGGTIGIAMCILMWLLGLAAIGAVVYFSVIFALRNNN